MMSQGCILMFCKIMQKEGSLKKEYVESGREDGFQSHGSMIGFLSCCLRVMIDCLEICSNIVFIYNYIVRKSFSAFYK